MLFHQIDFNKAKKLSNPKYEYFGLKIFWDAIQDNSKLDPKFFPNAFDACAKLMKNPNFKNEREKYLISCFDNLKDVINLLPLVGL